jgi:hypothetical protein
MSHEHLIFSPDLREMFGVCHAYAFWRFRKTYPDKHGVAKTRRPATSSQSSRIMISLSSQEITEAIGLGFEFPIEKVVVGPNGPKIAVGTI